ncbi:MAG: PAS domain S-box protein [Gammaproteobacteria bacterium]|nr:PAS domain S-box protein [Gammaproteobacteria bacterium]MBL6998558.1 PAS domain S-box protein [Gammaproteobacteria bacterium]
MKKNLPITNQEIRLKEQDVIISTTDLKGLLTYFNQSFLKISGFTADKLIGKSHNIIRHPDVPVAIFADLWKQIQAGKTWQGIIKNRCQNGDHYWVEAFVTPIVIDKKRVGYQSVRSCPSDEQIRQAQQLYNSLQP